MSGNALQAVLDKAAREGSEATLPTPRTRKAPKPANVAKPKVVREEAVAEERPAKFYRPSRDNRRFIGGHFEPAVGKQLRMIAVEDDTTVQALLEEALDLLFVKKGRQKVADLSK